MYRVYQVLTAQEARDNAERWAAGRPERLQWLHAQLGLDPAGASLTDLWRDVVSWYDAGRGAATTAPCPVWWVDEYDVDDTLAMADALSHPFCDELRRREPGVRLELFRKRNRANTNQIVMILGRWTCTPWACPRSCLERLRRGAPERRSGESSRDDYLESTLEGAIRGLDPWKRELDTTTAAGVSPNNDFDDGNSALAALAAGADLWSVERFDEDDEDNLELAVSFDDVFAHGFSAAIDAVLSALQQARIPGAGQIYRSDRELIVVEPAEKCAGADPASVTEVAERALRAALTTFGPARDE